MSNFYLNLLPWRQEKFKRDIIYNIILWLGLVFASFLVFILLWLYFYIQYIIAKDYYNKIQLIDKKLQTTVLIQRKDLENEANVLNKKIKIIKFIINEKAIPFKLVKNIVEAVNEHILINSISFNNKNLIISGQSDGIEYIEKFLSKLKKNQLVISGKVNDLEFLKYDKNLFNKRFDIILEIKKEDISQVLT